MEELLTVEEVAKRLKISKATVRRHIREGRLKAVKIGRVVRVSAEEVKELFRPIDEVKSKASTSRLAWVDKCRRLSQKIKESHHGVLLEDSSETIRSLREGRILSE
ncbi:MAG TPA: helix-turn-helix domain-containing protein [Thermodesulfobacteriota bacterium]|nr:helix-turn-helix domain-containing protein [Thermodesulfobacteriota bacterium]